MDGKFWMMEHETKRNGDICVDAVLEKARPELLIPRSQSFLIRGLYLDESCLIDLIRGPVPWYQLYANRPCYYLDGRINTELKYTFYSPIIQDVHHQALVVIR